MSFYVVQTRKSKKSKPSVTVVPSKWVENNVVHWPPNNFITLAKDENSTPDVKNWKQQKCKIVAKASTFDQAEETMHRLESITDSEDAVQMPMGTRLHPAKKKPKFQSKTYHLAPPVPQYETKISNVNPSMILEGTANHELISGTSAAAHVSYVLQETPESATNTILGRLSTGAQDVIPRKLTLDSAGIDRENTNLAATATVQSLGTNTRNIIFSPNTALPANISTYLAGSSTELARTERKKVTNNSATVGSHLTPALPKVTQFGGISINSHEKQKFTVSPVPRNIAGSSFQTAASQVFSHQGTSRESLHSNQFTQQNNAMFTSQTHVDGLGGQYLQLSDGTLIQISMENIITGDESIPNNASTQLRSVDSMQYMDIQPSGSSSLMAVSDNNGTETLKTTSDQLRNNSSVQIVDPVTPEDYPEDDGKNEISQKLDSILNRLGNMETALVKITSFMADTQRFMSMKSGHDLSQQESSRKRKIIEDDFSTVEELFPVTNENHLLTLENSLKTQAINNKIFAYFEFVFNLNGKRDSGPFFKLLLRKMLVPTVLLPFSWKGQSRNVKGIERSENRSFRECFPTFVKFVHRVIRAADYEYTQEQCDKSFSLFLRNKHTEISRFTGNGNLRVTNVRRRKKGTNTTIDGAPEREHIASNDAPVFEVQVPMEDSVLSVDTFDPTSSAEGSIAASPKQENA